MPGNPSDDNTGGANAGQRNNGGNNGNNSDLVTFGSAPVFKGSRSKGRGYKSPTATGLSTTTIFAQGEGDWRRLGDGSYVDKGGSDQEGAQSGGIRADYSYQVELTEMEPEERTRGHDQAPRSGV